MDIFRLLHTMSKIHDVVKPIKVGDVVKKESTNKLYKVSEVNPCKHTLGCRDYKPLFCKLVTVEFKRGDEKRKITGCYRGFHRVSKTDRFMYYMQGQNILNDYTDARERRPATDSNDRDGIS